MLAPEAAEPHRFAFLGGGNVFPVARVTFRAAHEVNRRHAASSECDRIYEAVWHATPDASTEDGCYRHAPPPLARRCAVSE